MTRRKKALCQSCGEYDCSSAACWRRGEVLPLGRMYAFVQPQELHQLRASMADATELLEKTYDVLFERAPNPATFRDRLQSVIIKLTEIQELSNDYRKP